MVRPRMVLFGVACQGLERARNDPMGPCSGRETMDADVQGAKVTIPLNYAFFGASQPPLATTI